MMLAAQERGGIIDLHADRRSVSRSGVSPLPTFILCSGDNPERCGLCWAKQDGATGLHAILMRKDPPVDRVCVCNTHTGGSRKRGVLIANKPQALRGLQ